MKIKGLEDAILWALQPWPNSWMMSGGYVDTFRPSWGFEDAHRIPEFANCTFLPAVGNEWHYQKYQDQVLKRRKAEVRETPIQDRSISWSINAFAKMRQQPRPKPRLQNQLSNYPKAWRGLIELELRRSGRWREEEVEA